MRICTSSSACYQSENKCNITTDMHEGCSNPCGPEPATVVEPCDLARFDAGPSSSFYSHPAEGPLSQR
jgi:hypothetical protein